MGSWLCVQTMSRGFANPSDRRTVCRKSPLHYKTIFWTAMVIALLSPRASNAQQLCLRNAWDAFNSSKYAQSMRYADECINEFSARAMREQKSLEESRVGIPPTGAVDSPNDRRKIFDHWAVNDVATAYFVRGQAAERLHTQLKETKYKLLAIESYKSASRLTYGRCWDPQGWFWSPAEAALDKLQSFK